MPFEHPESHVIARFDAPAFVRRARDVEEGWQAIINGCRTQYEEYLSIPKLRLARLVALAGEYSRIAGFLAFPESASVLKSLFEFWNPRLRVSIGVTESVQVLETSVQQLIVSFERFNRRWSRFVEQVPLTRLNEMRESYNKYYLLEKECAMRSPAVARDRFEPLPPVRPADLMALYPLLPVLHLKD